MLVPKVEGKDETFTMKDLRGKPWKQIQLISHSIKSV